MTGPVAGQSCCSDVMTPVGRARTWRQGPGSPPATLVLGHGAGGGIDAPDLLAARDAALACGLAVVRVEQPWRVAGRRVAQAPPRLALAWLAVLATLEGPVPVGGRSADHGFAVRRRDGRTAAQVHEEIVRTVRTWLDQTLT